MENAVKNEEAPNISTAPTIRKSSRVSLSPPSTKRRNRREFSAEQKQEVVAFAKTNGATAAGRKFDVNPNLIGRWKKTLMNVSRPSVAAEGAPKQDPYKAPDTSGILSGVVVTQAIEIATLKAEVANLKRRLSNR